MATQRYISTSFWDDEWIHKLDPSEKLLYLYFMTNPLTSIAGIYKLSESRICFDTGFNENTIRHIMSKFELAKKAYRFNEWIIIPNWSKHQKVTERDNIRKGIDKLLLSLPDDVFNYSVKVGYKYIYLNELGRPLQGGSEPSNYLELDSDMELDSDVEVPASKEHIVPSNQAKKQNDFSPVFDSYIELYKDIYKKEPVIVYSRITNQLKTLTKDLTIEQIVSAIEQSRNDEFSKKAKHEICVILSSGVVGRLVNESRSKPLPIPDKVPREKKTCPKCGGEIRGSACIECYTNFDYQGNEI